MHISTISYNEQPDCVQAQTLRTGTLKIDLPCDSQGRIRAMNYQKNA